MRTLFVIASFSLLMLSCKKNQTPATIDVKVGALLSLTGNWSTLGKTSDEAIRLALVNTNAYMETTSSPYRFSLVTYDTKLDTASAIGAIKRADSLGVKFIIGPQSSAEVAAIKSYADQKGIIVVSQGSTAGNLAINNDAIFRFCPGDALEGAAMARTIYASGKTDLITLARDDAGNKGLQTSVRTNFLALGGRVDSLLPYAASTTNFTSLLAQVKTVLQNKLTTTTSDKIAIYLASFDECVALFKQASADPIFSSVRWYGGDGVVLSAALPADPIAASFAATTGFIAPNFGLPAVPHPTLANIVSFIKSKTGLEPDAYALAAFDAFAVIAATVNAFPDADVSFEKTKNSFYFEASKYFGITGPLLLNTAGDRSTGSYDYWGIVIENGVYKWKLVGKSS